MGPLYLASYANSITSTPDGGFAIAGSKGGKVLLIRTNASAEILWAKTYDIGDFSTALSVQYTSDGGFILAGYAAFFYDSLRVDTFDIILIKTDGNGNLQWARLFSQEDQNEIGLSVRQTIDGGFALVGYGRILGGGTNNIILIKTDASGYMTMGNTYGNFLNHHYAYSLEQAPDGSFIVSGTFLSYYSMYDVFVAKLNASGAIQWAKKYGTPIDEYGKAIKRRGDNSLVIVGNMLELGFSDILVFRIDSTGNLIWSKTYSDTAYKEAASLEETNDGGYILIGNYNYSPNSKFMVIEIDSLGNMEYSHVIAPTVVGGQFYAKSIAKNPLGWFIMVGNRVYSGGTDIAAFTTYCNKFYPNLTTNNQPLAESTYSLYLIFSSMDVSYISPVVDSVAISQNIICSMSILEGGVPCAGNHITSGKGYIKVRFPGDFELRVYNASGELVKASKGRNEVSLDLKKGVYFVVVENRIIRRVVVW